MAVHQLILPHVAKALIQAHRRNVKVLIVVESSYSTPWSEQQLSHLPKHLRHHWYRLNRLGDANGDGITTPDEALQDNSAAPQKEARIPFLHDTEYGSRGRGFMHHNFVILDRSIVVTGSANCTSSGIHGDAGKTTTRGNVNHQLRLKSAELAHIFRIEFNELWGNAPGEQKKGLWP